MHGIIEKKADRRAYRRINTDVGATVVLRNERILHCNIRNYCKGGLYLEFGDHPSDFNKAEFPGGEILRVRFKAPAEEGGEKHFDVVVRVAHAFDTGVGCSFVQDEPAALKALSAIPASRREKSIGQTKTNNAASERNTDTDARDASVEILKKLIDRFFQGQFPTLSIHIKDTLLEYANSAKSNQEQEYYFHASVAVWENIDSLRDHCIDGCLESLSGLLDKQQLPREVDTLELSANNLSLVEDNSFEEWVFVSGIVSAAESQYSEELYELAQRLGKLAGHPVDNENNPVSPGIISWLFKEALEDLDVDLIAKKIIYRCFRQTVLDTLGVLYKDINKTLSDHGFLDEVPHKVTQPERPTSPAGLPRPENNPGWSAETQEFPAASTGQVAASFPVNQAGSQIQQLVGADQVLQLLPKLEGIAPGDFATHIKQQLLQGHKEHDTPVVLDQQVQHSIELTDSLIRSLLSDDKLPPVLRSSLTKLARPLLRTALKEPDFVTDASHPARRVLDTIERLAAPFHSELAYDPLSLEVNKTFQSLIERLGGNDSNEGESIFMEVDSSLQQIADRQEQTFELAVQRVIDSCEGEERLYQSKSAVARLIEEKIGSREVPLILANLLSLGWASLLVLTRLRDGPKSEVWQRYSLMIDQLLEWLDSSQKHPPINSEKALAWLETVQEGVSKVPVNPVKIKRTLDTLKKALLDNVTLFQLLQSKRIRLDKEKLNTIVQHSPRRSLQDLDRSEYASVISKIRRLRDHDRITYHPPHGKAQPLQLAWRSEDASRFVLVDGRGHKSLDLDAAGLAEAMKAKTITVLEDGNLPLVERSLQQMLGEKYNEASGQLKKDHITGLLNRHTFEKHLSEAIESAWQGKRHHILVALELDQFQLITDACGHDAAEKLLADVSNVLKAFITKSAVLAHLRLGEFAILFEDTQKKEVIKYAESERMAVNNYIFNWGEHQFNISASIGLTIVDETTEDIHDAMRNANSAVFIAKENGGNRIKVYDPDDLEMERHRLLTTSVVKIDEAFDNDRLELFLQPIVPIAKDSGLSPHYEVLLRVLNDEGRPIPPGDFIEAAE